MDNKIILGFVGELSGGKGTACAYLKEKYNAPSYRFSTILRDVLNRLYLEINRPNLQELSRILRETFGQDTLAKVIASDVKNDTSEIITVDGIRRLADIKYLKEIPGFHLIYLTADQKIRYERMTKRGENSDDNTKTFEEFQKDEQAEAELEIKETATSADFTINNDGTPEELYSQLEEILKETKNN